MALAPDAERALVLVAMTREGSEAPALLERLAEPAGCVAAARALLALPRDRRARRLAREAAALFAAPDAPLPPGGRPEWRTWLARRAQAGRAP